MRMIRPYVDGRKFRDFNERVPHFSSLSTFTILSGVTIKANDFSLGLVDKYYDWLNNISMGQRLPNPKSSN